MCVCARVWVGKCEESIHVTHYLQTMTCLTLCSWYVVVDDDVDTDAYTVECVCVLDGESESAGSVGTWVRGLWLTGRGISSTFALLKVLVVLNLE